MRNISDHSRYIYCHVCPNKKVYTYLANKTQYNKCRFWTTGHARHFSLKKHILPFIGLWRIYQLDLLSIKYHN